MQNEKINASNSVLWEAIKEGIKECIKDHGPIDQHWIGSATKRVMHRIIEKNAIQEMTTNDVKLMLQQIGLKKTGLNKSEIAKLRKYINKLANRIKILRQRLKGTDVSDLQRSTKSA